jgi:hypothetical protein
MRRAPPLCGCRRTTPWLISAIFSISFTGLAVFSVLVICTSRVWNMKASVLAKWAVTAWTKRVKNSE